MVTWWQQSVKIGIKTYESWRDDRTLRLGAGLAYYGLFTLFPFLAITAALAKPLFGIDEVEQFIADRLSALGAADPAASAASVSASLTEGSTQTALGLVGLGALIFSASLLFLAFADAVKTIWDVPYKAGWRSSVRRRLTSFAMVLVASTAIVVQFAVTAIAGAAQALMPDVELFTSLAQLVTSLISWAGLAALMVLLLRTLAPEPMSLRTALFAAVPTTVCLVIGTVVAGWYLRQFGGSSIAGAFGAVLALLTWVYIEAQIVLAGVQLSKVLARDASARLGAGNESALA